MGPPHRLDLWAWAENKEQCAVGGLVVAVEAAVWLKLGLSPSKVVDDLVYHASVYLRIAETKRAEGHWRADIQCPIGTGSWKTDLEEGEPGSSP